MKFRGGEFSTGTTGNFQSELTIEASSRPKGVDDISHAGHMDVVEIDVVGLQSSQ
jgi:hypothetical protein